MRLVDELGFDPVEERGSEDSWRQQPGTPCSSRTRGGAVERGARRGRTEPCARIPQGGGQCGESVFPDGARSLMVLVVLFDTQKSFRAVRTNTTKYAGKCR